jgi:serine protease
MGPPDRPLKMRRRTVINVLFSFAGATVLTIAFVAPEIITSSSAQDSTQPVVVAILDTGITAHPDLGWTVDANGKGSPGGATLPGYDFISDPWIAGDGDGWDDDPTDLGDGVRDTDVADRPSCRPRVSSWHGTNVAGTVAATGSKAIGVRGVAPDARILPVRILGRCGGNTADAAAGILWAAGQPVPGVPVNPNPASILNLSLSGSSAQCPRTLQTAIDTVVDGGALVVVAAGSRATNTATQTPANCKNVIVVGATDKAGRRAPTSNFGNEVTVSAPGGNMATRETDGIYTTTNDGRYRPRNPAYGYYQGSSAAVPHVAGTLAALAKQFPGSTPTQLTRRLLQPPVLKSFAPGQCDPKDGFCGAGIVQLN